MIEQSASGNPLAAGSLATFMTTCLPRDVSPQIRNPYDAIALAVHAGMVAVRFKLKGLGEEHHIGMPTLLSILQLKSSRYCRSYVRCP